MDGRRALSLVFHVVRTDDEAAGCTGLFRRLDELDLRRARLGCDDAHGADDCVNAIGFQSLACCFDVLVVDREKLDSVLGFSALCEYVVRHSEEQSTGLAGYVPISRGQRPCVRHVRQGRRRWYDLRGRSRQRLQQRPYLNACDVIGVLSVLGVFASMLPSSRGGFNVREGSGGFKARRASSKTQDVIHIPSKLTGIFHGCGKRNNTRGICPIMT